MMKGIYIMGQTERTGTNYLHKLLLEHKDIVKSTHPGEDRLVMELKYLNSYIKNTSKHWSNSWLGMDKKNQETILLKALQKTLYCYLNPDNNQNKLVITKSPSTIGIQYFSTFFTGFKLIILIRDGRNVVESIKQSFNRNYTDAMHQWTESTYRIIAYRKSQPKESNLLVKYESLNGNTEEEIKRILRFINLSEDQMNWDAVEKMPIIGSSESSVISGKIDWTVKLLKTNEFKPNHRYKNWSWFLRRKYNRICGKAAIELGYEAF